MVENSYGKDYYGLSYYGSSSNHDTPTIDLDKHRVDLSKYVPRFIYNEKTLNKIYKAQEYELAFIYWCIDDLLKQRFIDTATWGLSYWEEEYGIKTNLNLTYEERREIVKAKMRGQGICSKEMLKNVCEAFSGGEVNILENTAPYTFTIQFTGVKGIPRNMQGLKEAINDIKPAHMLYDFKYTYTNWDYLDNKNLSFNNAELLTWDELEIYD